MVTIDKFNLLEGFEPKKWKMNEIVHENFGN